MTIVLYPSENIIRRRVIFKKKDVTFEANFSHSLFTNPASKARKEKNYMVSLTNFGTVQQVDFKANVSSVHHHLHQKVYGFHLRETKHVPAVTSLGVATAFI